MTPSTAPTILFAGGGSGGHIFPNLAIAEQLAQHSPHLGVQMLVSSRPLDAQLLDKQQVDFTALPVSPLTMRWLSWAGWLSRWRASVKTTARLIEQLNVAAMVATGGFVSGPAIIAAGRVGLPTALVNLDAVSGKANRYLARRVGKVFSVFDVPHWVEAERIGMPIRRAARPGVAPDEARRHLGLKPNLETLLVCGGSQGAQTINDMMIELAQRGVIDSNWQVLHLSGPTDEAKLRTQYNACAINAQVTAFCDQMGLAWSAATLAISRAGAGGVAEAAVNAVPTVFMPYPFHKDQHQRLNALPLVESGGAVMIDDHAEATANAQQMAPLLRSLLSDTARLQRMADMLGRHAPPDGAATVARWVAQAAAQPG